MQSSRSRQVGDGLKSRAEGLWLSETVDITDARAVYLETIDLLSQLNAGFDCDTFEQLYSDINHLFDGRYPGYRASNTLYHDFEHTGSVLLATVRLVHGGHIQGVDFNADNVLLAMAAALFHDVGLIQADCETQGSGAIFTVGHEERSIHFMRQYLEARSFSSRQIQNCAHMIRCTILDLQPQQIPFCSREIEILGHILGTADILGQMSDRLYLEKLLLLFREFREAGIPKFETELDLLQKTKDFYYYIDKQRLARELGNVTPFMRTHFKHRWGVDRDLYFAAIQKNIDYLALVLDACTQNRNIYLQKLRRGGIVARTRQIDTHSKAPLTKPLGAPDAPPSLDHQKD